MHPLPTTPRPPSAPLPDAETESSLVSSDTRVSSTSSEDSDAPRAVTVPVLPAATASTPLQPQDDDGVANKVTPLRSVRPFSEIPVKVAKVQTLLMEVERNGATSHAQLRRAVAADRGKAEAHKLLKSVPELTGDEIDAGQIFGAYEQLRLGRKGPSPLELFLEGSETFGPLLFPPTGGVRDTRTGLYAELSKLPGNFDPVEYLLCFPGTGCAGAKDAQWKANVGQITGIGGLPKIYLQALKLAQELQDKLVSKGAKLSVAGHSLGGGIANFVGLALGLESWCFNAAALGRPSLAYLEMNGCLNEQRITQQIHVGFSDDWATHPTLMAGARALGRLAGKPGTTLPAGQVGRVFQLAPGDPHYPAQLNAFQRHMLRSLGGPLFQYTRNTVRNAPPADEAPARTTTTADTAFRTTTTTATPTRPDGTDGSDGDSQ